MLPPARHRGWKIDIVNVVFIFQIFIFMHICILQCFMPSCDFNGFCYRARILLSFDIDRRKEGKRGETEKKREKKGGEGFGGEVVTLSESVIRANGRLSEL